MEDVEMKDSSVREADEQQTVQEWVESRVHSTDELMKKLVRCFHEFCDQCEGSSVSSTMDVSSVMRLVKEMEWRHRLEKKQTMMESSELSLMKEMDTVEQKLTDEMKALQKDLVQLGSQMRSEKECARIAKELDEYDSKHDSHDQEFADLTLQCEQQSQQLDGLKQRMKDTQSDFQLAYHSLQCLMDTLADECKDETSAQLS